MAASVFNTFRQISLPRDPLFWQQHINLAAMLPIVKLTTDLFLTKEFFTWQNLGLVCASSLLFKISSSISLASKVEYFKKELLAAGVVGIKGNLQAFNKKCDALAREFNSKRKTTPSYLRAVLQEIHNLLQADDSHMAEHLGSLRKISLTNKERDERIIEGDKPDLNDPTTTWTAEERFRTKVARTNRKTELEAALPPTRKESFLQFLSSDYEVTTRFTDKLKGVSLPMVFKSNPPIFSGKERGSWRNVLREVCEIADAPEETGNLEGFSYAVATHAGYKADKGGWIGHKLNEDRWIADSFVVRGSKRSEKDYLVRVFGVADGHTGDFASDCARIHFSRILKEHIESLNKEIISPLDIYNALIKTFASLNNFFYELPNVQAGTTLTVSVIFDGMLFTAWAGDSRAILIKNQERQATRLVPLTKDHKPKEQEASVNARGGIVVNDQGIRVGYMYTDPETNETYPRGELAPGRTLGDCYMKRRISSRPSITMRPLSTIPEGSLLVLGTDGVFDNGSSRAYSDGLYQCRSNNLIDLAFQVVGSAVLAQWEGLKERYVDNTTAMVVRLPKFSQTTPSSAPRLEVKD